MCILLELIPVRYALAYLSVTVSSIAKLAHPYCSTAEQNHPAIPHIAWQYLHVWHFETQTTIKNLYTINHIVRCEILYVCALFRYSWSGIPNRSAFDFMFVVAETFWKFLYSYYATNFSYYADSMLYAFQPYYALNYASIIDASLPLWGIFSAFSIFVKSVTPSSTGLIFHAGPC